MNAVLTALPLGELKLLGHPEDKWRIYEGFSQVNVTLDPRPQTPDHLLRSHGKCPYVCMVRLGCLLRNEGRTKGFCRDLARSGIQYGTRASSRLRPLTLAPVSWHTPFSFPKPSPFGTEVFYLPEKKKKKIQVLYFSLGSWDKKPSGVGGLKLVALWLAIRS